MCKRLIFSLFITAAIVLFVLLVLVADDIYSFTQYSDNNLKVNARNVPICAQRIFRSRPFCEQTYLTQKMSRDYCEHWNKVGFSFTISALENQTIDLQSQYEMNQVLIIEKIRQQVQKNPFSVGIIYNRMPKCGSSTVLAMIQLASSCSQLNVYHSSEYGEHRPTREKVVR